MTRIEPVAWRRAFLLCRVEGGVRTVMRARDPPARSCRSVRRCSPPRRVARHLAEARTGDRVVVSSDEAPIGTTCASQRFREHLKLSGLTRA
jgi:hypothetical protein